MKNKWRWHLSCFGDNFNLTVVDESGPESECHSYLGVPVGDKTVQELVVILTSSYMQRNLYDGLRSIKTICTKGSNE